MAMNKEFSTKLSDDREVTSGELATALPLPPFVPGYPLIGNLLDFSRDPDALFARGQELYGNIFAINIGLKNAVVLIGAENAEFYFKNTDSILSMNKVYGPFENLFGKDFLFTASEEEYWQHRKCLLPAFKGKNLFGYAESMVVELSEWVENLGTQGSFDLTPSMEELTMSVAARAFLGAKFRAEMGEEFAELYRDFSGGLDFVLPHKLPLPKFRRCRAARKKLNAMMSKIIDERRNDEMASHTDFLQYLLAATDDSGNPLPDSQVINFVLGLVWAGHETTAGQVGWTLIRLLQNPNYLERVRDEVDGAFADGIPTDLHTYRNLEQLTWAIDETSRLNPSGNMTLRYNVEPYELGGYHIPADWLTINSATLGQRTEPFSNPEKFDPDRFSPERAEDKKHQFSISNFGGAVHKCLGMNFAYLEMQVILSMILYHYDMELLNQNPKIDKSQGAHRPESPCQIRYQKRVPKQSTHRNLPEQNLQETAAVEGCPFHQAYQADQPTVSVETG